jgi:hypothetical protein
MHFSSQYLCLQFSVKVSEVNADRDSMVETSLSA